MLNNTRTRKATTRLSPEQVRDRIQTTITSFCHRNGIGYETVPSTLGPLADSVLMLHTALKRDTRVVRFSVFNVTEGGARPTLKTLVTLHSWYLTSDNAAYGHKTTTASERSITQKLFNIVHDELNGWAEELGTTR